ncbi:MAG: VTT domain-containing protein [Caldilineales bacterium]
MKRALAVLAILAVGVLIVRYNREVIAFVSDEAAVQAWVIQLGPLGPLGVVALNAIQVVIAFIPGYVMQLVAGFLYGWPMGAVYATIGMLIGGFIAVMLARVFGRPLVIRMVGEKRVDRWEHVARLDSLAIWFILMLAPFGDVPYYIAGLTSLAIWKIIAIAAFVRTPSVILAVLVGSGAVSWRSPWVIGAFGVMVVIALLALRYQDRIERWVDERLLTILLRWTASRTPIQPQETQEHDPTPT